jgi:hypothetical protein
MNFTEASLIRNCFMPSAWFGYEHSNGQSSPAQSMGALQTGKLKPGESVGWRSTSGNEEALVIIQEQGRANIEGHPDGLFTRRC